MSFLYALLSVILASIIGAYGALFLKLSTEKFSFSIKSMIKNKYLVFGFLCYGFSTALFIFALKYEELSILYPFVSMTYIWVVLLSKKYLKENINLWKTIGVLLIIVGVSLIGFGG